MLLTSSANWRESVIIPVAMNGRPEPNTTLERLAADLTNPISGREPT
jgi:hypothetical protein